MKKNIYLSEIEATYKTIDNGFDKAFSSCKTAKDKEILTASRDAARDAFWTATESELVEGSVFVEKLHKDLKGANLKLKNSLEKLDDVSALIKAMEEAVRLAASLAALAAV